MRPSNRPVGNTDFNMIEVFGAYLFNFYFEETQFKIICRKILNNLTNEKDWKNLFGPRTVFYSSIFFAKWFLESWIVL